MHSKLKTSLIITFIWIGFMSAISFMEAWLKFQADGLSLTVGLSIGKLVFEALNKVEWAFFLIIIVNLLFRKALFFNWKIAIIIVPGLILLLQSFLLLPALSARVDALHNGIIPPPSNLHYYYVAVELIKLISLFIFGINLLKDRTKHYA